MVGLTLSLYCSSLSGGWHGYIFFDDKVDSKEVQEGLRAWLTANKYIIKNGTLEIFPSGNGLRLPLQKGFAWLDNGTNVILHREELTTTQALNQFLNDRILHSTNWTVVKRLIETQLTTLRSASCNSAQVNQDRLAVDGFEELFTYRLIKQNYEEGRQFWLEGLKEKGQRHHAILCLEHYLWHGDSSAGVPALPGESNNNARYRLILAWLQAKHNGFCNHINRGNWRKVEAQISRAVKWRRPSNALQVRSPYSLTERLIDRLITLSKTTGRTWSVEDLQKGNFGRETQARQKIHKAVELLIAQCRRITIRQLMRLTGCSYHTIKKHPDLWSNSELLPRAAGDQNSVLDLKAVPSGAPGFEKQQLAISLLESDSVSSESGLAEVKPPLLFCLANQPIIKPPMSKGLRSLNGSLPSFAGSPPFTATPSLTSGPWFDDIHAERQMRAGGGFYKRFWLAVLHHAAIEPLKWTNTFRVMLMSEEKAQYLKDGESFEEGAFSWFVCVEQSFCAPLKALTLHHTDPKRFDLTIDLTGITKIPRMVFNPLKPPMYGIDGNLHEALERSKSVETPQKFYLCSHDEPANVETWRQLQFQGTYGQIEYRQSVQLPEDLREQLQKRGGILGQETASFTLTTDGPIKKTGDWTRVSPEGIPLDPFVQDLRNKAAKELAEKDFTEKAAQVGKKAWNITKAIAKGSIELIGNIQKDAENSAREKRALEAREGTFYSSKAYPQIYEQVWKILQHPIGQFRFGVNADTSNSDITAVCTWTEDIPAFPNAARELTCTFLFQATESGTTITYEHMLYEVPPGSLFANQLVRTVNSWVKALAEQSPGP